MLSMSGLNRQNSFCTFNKIKVINHNIKSANDYAQLLIEGILEVENLLPPHERLSKEMLGFWFNEIKKTVDITYNDYIIGKRDYYMLDGDEMYQIFETAHTLYVDDVLTGMLNKNLLSMSVGDGGDILYSLSDEGREVIEQMSGKAQLN